MSQCGKQEDAQVSFEKHKIFLYRQDFEKFLEGLQDVMKFIRLQQPEEPYAESHGKSSETTDEQDDFFLTK